MESSPLHNVSHDGVGHHPLGAGSYYFRRDIVKWLAEHTTSDRPIHIFIGTQPNSSPHLGNLANIALAFALGSRLVTTGRKICVSLDYVDTAPTPQQDVTVDGVIYQRSLRWSGQATVHSNSFQEVVTTLSKESGVDFVTRTQQMILLDPLAEEGIQHLVQRRHELAKLYSPHNGCIGLRAACPEEGCGLADKAGIWNQYCEDRISFHCPFHGTHSVQINEPSQRARLELNTPLRNLLRNYLFRSDVQADWVQVVGADYAGFYQEQFLWRPLSAVPDNGRHPLVVYSPQILDWSGAKLSKSLYVRGDAYQYLRDAGYEYVLSYELFKSHGLTLHDLFQVCADWVDHPYKLFRSYTLYYMDALLRETHKSAHQPVQDTEVHAICPADAPAKAEGLPNPSDHSEMKTAKSSVDPIATVLNDHGTSITTPRMIETAVGIKETTMTCTKETTDSSKKSPSRMPAFHFNSASSDWPTEY